MAALYYNDKKVDDNLTYVKIEGEFEANNQSKTIDITENGGTTVTYDEGYTGLESVTINTHIQGGGGGGLDFTQIGYEGTPQSLQTPYDYAKQIYDNWDASVTNRYQAFKNDTQLGYFPLVDTSNVTDMSYMFYECSNLEIVPPINTSNVTSMGYMFYICSGLTSLDLSSFDTSKVANMSDMFSYCRSLTSIDLSKFDTSNVTNMHCMFYQCSSLTSLDLSSFDTSNVTDMGGMFNGCSGLKSLDLSKFDTSNVTNMQSIFYMNSIIKIDGLIDIQNISGTINKYYFAGYTSNRLIRKLTFRNLAYNSNNTSYDFTYIQNWGVNSDEVPDAKQSLIDSLLTYSFDRATAGYSTCTITLHANSKTVLSEDEIAQITSKGYTIA